MNVWTSPSTTKVQKTDAPTAANTLDIAIARNEYGSMQLVVNGSATNVDVVMSTLTKGSDTIPASAWNLYRVVYVDCEADGWLADSMVPFINPETSQRIGGQYGAPFTVPAGENISVWAELRTKTAVAGTYTGTATVSSDGNSDVVIPVNVEIWDIDMPETSKMDTFMRLNDGTSASGLYYEALHDHRMDPWSVETLPGPYLQNGSVVFPQAWLDGIESYFDGSMFADGIPGKRWNMGYGQWTLYGQIKDGTRAERQKIFADVDAKLSTYPWVSKVYWFFADEPKAADIPQMIEYGEDVRDYSPNIPWLLTTHFLPELEGLVDIWDCIINYEVLHWGTPWPEAYREEVRKGREFVINITVNSTEYISPNCFIHRPGMNARVWSWCAHTVGASGLEFWETKAAPSVIIPKTYGSAWGDGSYFYRGLPAELGIPNEIALPSIRLKQVRDSIQDYELLSMVSDRNVANRIAKTYVQDLHHYDDSFVEPIKYIRDYWSPDGSNDYRGAPGRFVWDNSYDSLVSTRAALASTIMQQ